MSELFLTVLNMNLTASYVILLVILIRIPLKKVPQFISYALWGVVAFRLIIPFSFESIFSLMPRNTNAVPIPLDIIYQQSPQIDSGIKVVDSFVSEALPVPNALTGVNPLQIYTVIGAYIWGLGIMVLLIHSLVSILRLKRQLKCAEFIEKNIFEAKNLKTPFVLGFIRPKIYLPVGLGVEERSYILFHEQTHIHRKDHIIKILAFLTLSIHWFNPLVWIAFMLMSTDMELSCDEKVLKAMKEDNKKPYANSLLSLAAGKHIFNGSPIAFGEGNIKRRVMNVLNFKKSTVWIVVVSVAFVVAISIGLVSNKVNDGTGNYNLHNFYVNGFMLGAETSQMDTSLLTPTSPLNVNDGYDFNFEEVRYRADEETGRLRKMLVNVYDNGILSMLVAHANGKDNVSLDSNETYQIEGIEAILGKGKTGWHDREQKLLYMEYVHKEGRLSASVRFVYTEGRSEGITHRLVWVIAESSLPYPYQDESSLGDLKPMIQVGDILFLDTGKEVSVEIGDSDILGEVVSSVGQHEMPAENGQTNFGSIGSKYAYYEGNILVLINSKWVLFETDSGNRMMNDQTIFDVEGNLAIIMSSPVTSSNPQDYINEHNNEYENFMKYGGEDSLQYLLSQFEAGNAKGLRGQIMMLLCKELLGARNNVTDESLPPQEWYDALSIRQEILLPDYEYDGQDIIEKLVYDTEIERDSDSKRGGFVVVAPKIFGSYEEEDRLKVFVTTYHMRYKLFDSILSEEGGSIIPVAITYRKGDSGGYILEKYEQARDGSEFNPSIRKYCTMPLSGKEIKGLADQILKHYSDYEDISIQLYDNLTKHLKINGITNATLTNSLGEVEFSISEPENKP